MTEFPPVERVEIAPGYTISRLIHGGWQFSTGHRLSGPQLDDSIDVLVRSAELGVTTFDCADIYTGVEELYGEFLRRWRTTSAAAPIQIHTKLVPDDDAIPGIDRTYVERIIDRSLMRLGVECLDLVQFYWWRPDIPGTAQTLSWLEELRRAGKIRHVGVTNVDADTLRSYQGSGTELITNQVQYSVLDRRPESELAERALGSGPSLLAFGTLAGGFLTDRWLDEPDPAEVDSRSMVKYRLIIDEFGGWESYQELLRTLRLVADEHGSDIATVAVRFVLDQPGVSAAIVGATRLGQMERNVRALALPLSEADHQRIRAHLDRAPGPSGPVFGLERRREGPHGRIMRYNLNREGDGRPA